MRRARILLAAVIAVATVTAAGCDTAQRDDGGDVVEPGEIGAQDVQVGDCYNDDNGQSGEQNSEVLNVAAVPCEEPHDNEVYALFDLPDGEFPGEDAVVEQGYQGCLDRFAQFVGMAYDQVSLDIGILYPVQEGWEAGDREVVCSVYDPAGQATGTLEGKGEAYRLAVEGDCMNEAGVAVDCADEHYAEIYLETELDGQKFPGSDAVDREAMALCEQAFAEFVGVEWGSSSLDIHYWTPDEAAWADGVRLVTCAVYDPEGPLTGSVRERGRNLAVPSGNS